MKKTKSLFHKLRFSQISTFKTYIQNYSMIFAPVNKILTPGL